MLNFDVSSVIERNPLTISSNIFLAKAVNLMSDYRCSCALILADNEIDSKVVGLLTDSDIVKIAASNIDFATVPLSYFIGDSINIITEKEVNNIFEVIRIMCNGKIRHLPVVSETGSAVGLISYTTLQDVLNPLLLNQQFEVQQLNQKLQNEINKCHRIEQELSDSENRFRSIFEQAAVGIGLVDLSGNFFKVNQQFCEISGYEELELLKLSWQCITHRDDLVTDLEYVEELLTGKNLSYTLEKRYIHNSGEARWVNVNVSLVRDGQNNPQYFIRVVKDMTPRKQAELQLKKALFDAENANQVKNEFLSRMSHEFRTPLNSILGFAQVAQRDANCPPKIIDYLKIINRNGQNLLGLINDVLEMSKIESGKAKLFETSFDFYRLLDSIKTNLHQLATFKKITLIFDIAPNVPRYIITDEDKLRQVVLNLLENAIKFTKEGSVKLLVSLLNGYTPLEAEAPAIVHFEIIDTGLGISEAEVNNLFKAFVQTSSGKQIQKGTGLGLSISQFFIQLMGGDITVKSSLGKGSIFGFDIKVKLALAMEMQFKLSSRKIVKGLASNQASYRLLIAEDSDEHRHLLIKLLEPLNFEIREATNGQEAVDLYHSWRPNLIFMDLQMPVMTGYQATKMIQATPGKQKTKIIALTASAFEDERLMIFDAGCNDFISKPFQTDEIFNKIAQHLGVAYIYCDSNSQQTSTHITPKDLAVMPAEWLQQLNRAACECSDEQILQLVETISSEYKNLASALRELAYNFHFDEIIKLALNSQHWLRERH